MKQISPEHRANRKRKINPHTVQNNSKMSFTKMVKNSTAAAFGVTERKVRVVHNIFACIFEIFMASPLFKRKAKIKTNCRNLLERVVCTEKFLCASILAWFGCRYFLLFIFDSCRMYLREDPLFSTIPDLFLTLSSRTPQGLQGGQ